MFKVILCIPPDYDHNYPPLGTPALCAFLKQSGIDTSQIDLNVNYRDFLAKHISGSSIDLGEKRFLLGPIIKKFFFEKLQNRYYSDLLVRDKDGVLPYLPYDNNTNSSFYFCERLLSSKYLMRYLEDRQENTFYQFYEDENFLGFLDREDIRLLGISIISPSQVIASLTLGLLVKKYLSHIHVNIGGQWPTLYRNMLIKNKELFRCLDSIITFEGEKPLYELAKCLKANKNIPDIPNVILRDTPLEQANSGTELDLNLLPCPDFDGLPLETYNDSYNDKAINLTYETSRGCYWSKCAYCVDLPLPKPSYRKKSPDLIVQDIKKLKSKYNAEYLLLSDPGLSPLQMLEISQKIISEGIKIKWWCMTRLDNGFNRKVFDIAAKSGLRRINFGFESASDSICQKLNKGNQKKRSSRIIQDCFESGIEVGLQTILGLPFEGFSDGLETIDFLVSNRKYISQVIFNIYYLTPSNFIYREPDKYGIEYKKNDNLPFRFFVPFKNISGMTEDEAYLLQTIYFSLMDNNHREQKFSLEQTLYLSKDISEGSIELNLNQESSQLHYLCHRSNDEYIFLENQEKEVISLIKQGLRIKDIYLNLCQKYPEEKINPRFSEFLDRAINRGFLKRNE